MDGAKWWPYDGYEIGTILIMADRVIFEFDVIVKWWAPLEILKSYFPKHLDAKLRVWWYEDEKCLIS